MKDKTFLTNVVTMETAITFQVRTREIIMTIQGRKKRVFRRKYKTLLTDVVTMENAMTTQVRIMESIITIQFRKKNLAIMCNEVRSLSLCRPEKSEGIEKFHFPGLTLLAHETVVEY